VYLSIPEYGFSSKILSAKKKKRFQPVTPAKKNKAIFNNEIYSPMANLLSFEEDRERKMVVKMTQVKSQHFSTHYEVVSKLGEGSFGEAFKVRSKFDGSLYAVKKAKQKYIGYRDRE
jgi:hypothetical protein